jgi:TPR repeat protein
LYSNGIGVIQNKTLALEYFSLAAESGDVESIFNYAMMVYDGTDEVNGNSTLATLELLSIKTQSKSA